MTVLAFLNRIEGSGYGGMSEFEIARTDAKEMAEENERLQKRGFECLNELLESKTENERLRAALQEIADDPCMDPEGNKEMALKALNQQQRSEK